MTSLAAADRFRILSAFAVLPLALGLVAYLAVTLVSAFHDRTDFSLAKQLAVATAVFTVLLSPIAFPLVFLRYQRS